MTETVADMRCIPIVLCGNWSIHACDARKDVTNVIGYA